VVNILKAVECI